jgi:biopolymer transport protein ExbD
VTNTPTNTPIPPTDTDTPVPPTATEVPPTATATEIPPTATDTPVAPTATATSCAGICLIAGAAAGESEIQVNTTNGLSVGQTITIGGPNPEDRRITGFASVILNEPLAFAHPAGAPITVVEPTKTPVPSVSAVPSVSRTPNTTRTPSTKTPAATKTTPPVHTKTAVPTATPRHEVKCPDFNGNGRVDLRDLLTEVLAVARHSQNAKYDINNDGVVNHKDIIAVLKQLGAHCGKQGHSHDD